jgi:predicted metal-dependent enzyme (double-stranded beta helix superfamily)
MLTRALALDSWSLGTVSAHLAASIDPDHELPGTGRRYARLEVGRLATRVDAWLIAWPPGSVLPMHDHAGSRAVLRVLRSELHERFVDGGRISERRLVRGAGVHLPPDHLHEVANVGDAEALSLHVYSPTLATIRFHDEPDVADGGGPAAG